MTKMISTGSIDGDAARTQREDGGSSPTPVLKKHEWWVRGVTFDVAHHLVREYHYAGGGSNTYTVLHGLFRRGELWDNNCKGVAWWIPPTKSAALATYPEDWQGVLSLSRLVLTPDAPKNAASFLIGASMRLIDRDRWPCLVTYADEWQGHTGTIYEASGWDMVGTTKPERIYVRNGRMIARKAGPRTRTHDEMVELGTECIGSFAKRKFINIAA